MTTVHQGSQGNTRTHRTDEYLKQIIISENKIPSQTIGIQTHAYCIHVNCQCTRYLPNLPSLLKIYRDHSYIISIILITVIIFHKTTMPRIMHKGNITRVTFRCYDVSAAVSCLYSFSVCSSHNSISNHKSMINFNISTCVASVEPMHPLNSADLNNVSYSVGSLK